MRAAGSACREYEKGRPGNTPRGAAALIAALCLITVAIADPDPAGAEGVTIGVPLPLSGVHSVVGQMARTASLLAVEEINARGGIDGEDLQLDIRDTGGRPETARLIVDNFIRVKGYPVIMGGVTSAETAAMALLCQRRGVPFLAVTGAEDSITRKGYSHVFRIGPTFSMYPDGLIQFLHAEADVRSIAIVFERSSFGDTLAEVIGTAAEDHGWQVADVLDYPFGTLRFQPLIERLNAADPDVVFLLAFGTDAARLVRGIRESGMEKTVLAGASPVFNQPVFHRAAGEWDEGVLTSVLWSPELRYSGITRFTERFRKRYNGDPDYHAAEAYSAVKVLAQALKRADGLTADGIRNALAATSLRTIFGTVRFSSDDGFTNQNRPSTYAAQWQDGDLRILWPAGHRSAEWVPPGRSEPVPEERPQTTD